MADVDPALVRTMKLCVAPAIAGFVLAPLYLVTWLSYFRAHEEAWGRLRTGALLLLSGLFLAPPFLWRAFVPLQAKIPPPGVATTGFALLISGFFLALAGLRLRRALERRRLAD